MRIAVIPLAALVVSLGAAQSGLKIVVIDGENAVNIIQQKTAVAPVVEVRDRNNLPVPGAIVTFSLGGPGASFGGASTLAVTTNAAGQAVAAGFAPTAAGAIQINATAVFQGQTVVAAITQTNVMTAAEAAAAASGASGASSGASGAGAGAGAGGGVSGTTLGIVGAAVAGGAVAATEVVKKNGEGEGEGGKVRQQFTGSFSVTTTDTLTSRVGGQVCTITRSVTGTASLSVRTDDPNNVDGDLNMDGTAPAVSFTCFVENPTQRFGAGVKVSGPMSALRGSMTTTNTGTGTSGETITGTQTTSFEGAISGATMTGTVKIEVRSQSTGGGGGGVDGFQSTIISLTLTKS